MIPNESTIYGIFQGQFLQWAKGGLNFVAPSLFWQGPLESSRFNRFIKGVDASVWQHHYISISKEIGAVMIRCKILQNILLTLLPDRNL